MSQRRVVLVKQSSELHRVDKRHVIIAGSMNVAALLHESGTPHITAGELSSDHWSSSILGNVANSLQVVEEAILSTDIDIAFKSSLFAKLVKKLFHYELSQALEREFGTTIYTANGDLFQRNSLKFEQGGKPGSQHRDIADHSNKSRESIRGEGYYLDFRSASGKNFLDVHGSLAPVILTAKYGLQSPIIVGLWNWYHMRDWMRSDVHNKKYRLVIRKNPRHIRHLVQALASIREQVNPSLFAMIECTVIHGFQEYLDHKDSAFALFSQSSLPSFALFNHVNSIGLGGIASALDKLGVETKMYSHGCMVSYGSRQRALVSSALANSIYNQHPAMRTLVPRSPLQASSVSGSEKVVRCVRQMSSSLRSPSKHTQGQSRTFRAYYAPNFLPWHSAYHGLTITCFETYRCLKELARCVQDKSWLELYIRIKTTNSDQGIAKPKKGERALMPSVLKTICSSTSRIHDATLESHADNLRLADLVITEGVTAVIFEALEYRKPVLLLNDSAMRFPSLPSVSLSESSLQPRRAAVYSVSRLKFLNRAIELIRDFHVNGPLEDSELSPYIWV